MNKNAKCSMCAHFREKFLKVEEVLPVRVVRVSGDKYVKRVVEKNYCSSYGEVVVNVRRAEKCRRFVKKVDKGPIDEFMEVRK